MSKSTRVVAILMIAMMTIGAFMPTVPALLTTQFGDGSPTHTVHFNGPGPGSNADTLIKVPKDAIVTNATLTARTGPGPIVEPRMDVGDDGDTEWTYSGPGYGALGSQHIFRDGTKKYQGFFPYGGASKEPSVLLPTDADVKNAMVDLTVVSSNITYSWIWDDIGLEIIPSYVPSVTTGDLDGDGDRDALVGDAYGYVHHFNNTGTAADPNMVLTGYLSAGGSQVMVGNYARPALVDLDADADLDLAIGNYSGYMTYFKNIGNATNMSFDVPEFTTFTVVTAASWADLYANPAFADLNNDGDLDLLVGRYDGQVDRFMNTGTVNAPNFISVGVLVDTNGRTLGNSYGDRTDYTMSSPALGDIDGDGDSDLILGDYQNGVFWYNLTPGPSIVYQGRMFADGNSNPEDFLRTNFYMDPDLSDLDGDGDQDLMVTDYYGSVYYFKNAGTAQTKNFMKSGKFFNTTVHGISTPTFGDLNGDGNVDMVVGEDSGDVNFYRNDWNNTDPVWTEVPGYFPALGITDRSAPRLVDWDNDRDLDLLVGSGDVPLRFLRNNGTRTVAVWNSEDWLFQGVTGDGWDNWPCLYDLDADGDWDLTLGSGSNSLYYYENLGTNAIPNWLKNSAMYDGISSWTTGQRPLLHDMDYDGDGDLIIGQRYGRLSYYSNTGDVKKPVWSVIDPPFDRIDTNDYSYPDFYDFDGDGFEDFVSGSSNGKIKYWGFNAVTERREFRLDAGMDGEYEILYNGTQAILKYPGLNLTSEARDDVVGTPDFVDKDGNEMSVFPLSFDIQGRATVYMDRLNVTYDHSVNITGFEDEINDFVKLHQGSADATGNISVPIMVKANSGGDLVFDGLKIEYMVPPRSQQPFKDLTADEDNVTVLCDLGTLFYAPGGEPLNYSFAENTFDPAIIGMSIGPTGSLVLDASTGASNDNWTGKAQVQIEAKDGNGLRTLGNVFNVTVVNVGDAPVFVSVPSTDVKVGSVYLYAPKVEDGDKDPLLFSLTGAPEGMVLDTATGIITWVPSNYDLGTVHLELQASDGPNTAVQEFDITVIGDPSKNNPPVFVSEPGTYATVDVPYRYVAKAIDPDPLTHLRFGLVTGPAAMTMDVETGQMDWTPMVSQLGTHKIKIEVTDGLVNVSQQFNVTVTSEPYVNHPPVIVSVPTTMMRMGASYSYLLLATDPDMGDMIRYSIKTGPIGMTMDDVTGRVSWTPTATSAGKQVLVVLMATDGKENVTQEFLLEVVDISTGSVVHILNPRTGDGVQGKVNVVGVVDSTVAGIVESVEVKVGSGEWKKVNGTSNWSIEMDLTGLSGQTTISARAWDGTRYSALDTVSITVDAQGSGGGDGDGGEVGLEMASMWPIILLLIILIIVAAIAGVYIGRRQNRDRAMMAMEAERAGQGRDARRGPDGAYDDEARDRSHPEDEGENGDGGEMGGDHEGPGAGQDTEPDIDPMDVPEGSRTTTFEDMEDGGSKGGDGVKMADGLDARDIGAAMAARTAMSADGPIDGGTAQKEGTENEMKLETKDLPGPEAGPSAAVVEDKPMMDRTAEGEIDSEADASKKAVHVKKHKGKKHKGSGKDVESSADLDAIMKKLNG